MARKVVLCPSSRIVVETPDSEWCAAFAAWRLRGFGGEEPFPQDHVMFSDPIAYGAMPLDDSGSPIVTSSARSYIVDAMRGYLAMRRAARLNDACWNSDISDRAYNARRVASFMVSRNLRFPRRVVASPEPIATPIAPKCVPSRKRTPKRDAIDWSSLESIIAAHPYMGRKDPESWFYRDIARRFHGAPLCEYQIAAPSVDRSKAQPYTDRPSTKKDWVKLISDAYREDKARTTIREQAAALAAQSFREQMIEEMDRQERTIRAWERSTGRSRWDSYTGFSGRTIDPRDPSSVLDSRADNIPHTMPEDEHVKRSAYDPRNDEYRERIAKESERRAQRCRIAA